jgi:hypothetical protein
MQKLRVGIRNGKQVSQASASGMLLRLQGGSKAGLPNTKSRKAVNYGSPHLIPDEVAELPQYPVLHSDGLAYVDPDYLEGAWR